MVEKTGFLFESSSVHEDLMPCFVRKIFFKYTEPVMISLDLDHSPPQHYISVKRRCLVLFNTRF